jgi:hypothetical protein
MPKIDDEPMDPWDADQEAERNFKHDWRVSQKGNFYRLIPGARQTIYRRRDGYGLCHHGTGDPRFYGPYDTEHEAKCDADALWGEFGP